MLGSGPVISFSLPTYFGSAEMPHEKISKPQRKDPPLSIRDSQAVLGRGVSFHHRNKLRYIAIDEHDMEWIVKIGGSFLDYNIRQDHYFDNLRHDRSLLSILWKEALLRVSLELPAALPELHCNRGMEAGFEALNL